MFLRVNKKTVNLLLPIILVYDGILYGAKFLLTTKSYRTNFVVPMRVLHKYTILKLSAHYWHSHFKVMVHFLLQFQTSQLSSK